MSSPPWVKVQEPLRLSGRTERLLLSEEIDDSDREVNRSSVREKNWGQSIISFADAQKE